MVSPKKITTFATHCPDGEMVDALVSGASVERRVGSSPILGTRAALTFEVGAALFISRLNL